VTVFPGEWFYLAAGVLYFQILVRPTMVPTELTSLLPLLEGPDLTGTASYQLFAAIRSVVNAVRHVSTS